jgi:hypothetical protein
VIIIDPDLKVTSKFLSNACIFKCQPSTVVVMRVTDQEGGNHMTRFLYI